MFFNAVKIVVILLLMSNTAYATQWPVAEYLSEGELNSEGKLSGTKGDSSQLSSDFGPRLLKKSPMHSGIDIPVKDGTPVYATIAGTVKSKGWCSGGGYRIVIEGNDKRLHSYMHLIDDVAEDEVNIGKYGQTFEKLVKENDKVTEGQQIGWSDSTVNKIKGKIYYGPAHLDYKVYRINKGRMLYINPLSVLPYTNNEIPRVSIEKPEDGSELSAGGWFREIEPEDVIINVKTSEKDLTEVELYIDGDWPPGVDFNFSHKGRKKVSMEIG